MYVLQCMPFSVTIRPAGVLAWGYETKRLRMTRKIGSYLSVLTGIAHLYRLHASSLMAARSALTARDIWQPWDTLGACAQT
jgi:hypothetical protein